MQLRQDLLGLIARLHIRIFVLNKNGVIGGGNQLINTGDAPCPIETRRSEHAILHINHNNDTCGHKAFSERKGVLIFSDAEGQGQSLHGARLQICGAQRQECWLP